MQMKSTCAHTASQYETQSTAAVLLRKASI